MPPTTRSLFWLRTDTPGTDHALIEDRAGLVARGTAQAVDPLPYTCRYDVSTDGTWSTVRLEVTCEGSGWLRTVRLERAVGRWRVTATEQGDLDAVLTSAGGPGVGMPGLEDPDRLAAAVDVDLSSAPLFNTLPVRRLGLPDAAPGSSHRVGVAWVLLPGLQVLPAEQVYTVLGPGLVRLDTEGFHAEIELDAEGYVTRYPGLAERAGASGG